MIDFSHFDGIRAIAFHPVDPVLISASEDHTLKLWNLQKTVQAKKFAFSQVSIQKVFEMVILLNVLQECVV